MERSGTSVGLIVVGLGSVGSSLIAGIEAARQHLVHPWGTLSDAGGAARLPGSAANALREMAPLAELPTLALGAFELHEDDAHRAAVRAGVLSRSLVDELRPQLRRVRAMIGARQAPTRRHLADTLAEDLRGFLAHHRCERGIVVCTVPGPRSVAGKLPFGVQELWDGLESSADWVSPGLVYAAAAALAGCGFVSVATDPALSAPGVAELFGDLRAPVAGTGLLGPDATLRELVARLAEMEGLGLSGAASLTTRAEERGARLWGGPDRTQEMGLAAGFAGASFELSLELRGQTAAFLAGRALDAALLVELAGRAGRTGAQPWMDALFEKPLATAAPREAPADSLAQRRQALLAELPALAASARRAA